jgi:hypothetical protein
MRWIWRALCPTLPLEGASGETTEGGLRLRLMRCTPETLDELLPPADRVPVSREPASELPAGGAQLSLDSVLAPRALPVSRLSYSGLEDYKRCGYRFYLERALRLPAADPADGPLDAKAPRAGDELAALLRGSIVHELLEGIDFAHPVAPSPARVAGRIEAHGEPVREADVGDLRGLVQGFLAAPLSGRLRGARRVRTELPFAFTLAPGGAGGRSLLVNGVVDAHALEHDRTLIVDYKSDRLHGREPAAVCEEEYATQRLVYALAALRAGAERVEVAYLFLERPAEPVRAVFESADAAGLERGLLSLAGGVVKARFEPTDAPHRELCATCPGRPALCTWGPERTLSEAP